MTRDEANRAIQELARAEGGASSGLGERNLTGVQFSDGREVYFEYRQPFVPAEPGALKCSALVYRFHTEPKPGLLDGFRAEEQAGTPTGGGALEYQEQGRALFLARSYSKPPALDAFREEMAALRRAARVWQNDVLERVTRKVFHPGS